MEKNGDYIELKYNNFGKIPNTSGRITQIVQFSPISKNDLISKSYGDMLPIIMPTQEWNFHIKTLTPDLMESAQNGNVTLFLGVLIDYPYGEEKMGHYGALLHYDKDRKNFVFDDSWSD